MTNWRYVAAALLVCMACAGLALVGCVETAECNATVDCPGDEVCYEFTCRLPCEKDDDCEAEQACLACQPSGAAEDVDKCFGDDRKACVPEDA